MKLAELYRAFSANSEAGEIARVLLSQTHWFVVNAEFDPKTGEALPQSLSAFLAKVAQPATDVGTHRDRLWRIAEHSRASVERLFRALNESPRREQAMLPVHAVRELDANSFIKLSNRPGRNIREKLAGKPYVQAVRRFQSVNLPENRLLKAFVTRLAELLELRFDCIGVEDDDLLPIIQSWLHSDEVQAIANWDNLPPNNTLLSHRDYRRVWDAWRLLQTLDDDIARDLSQIEERKQNMREWEQFAKEWTDGDYRFADMPIRFDYEKLNIRTWVDIQKKPGKIRRSFSSLEITAPVCIDLTVLHPRYATTTATQILPMAFLWQLWQNNVEAVDIELYNSDAAYFHPDTTSISSSDLFFSKDNTSEHFDRAARSFASKLCKVFKNDTLIWLVPDALNDFELKVIRRNLNARFHDAEHLPRSVAAAFEQVSYSKIKNEGFSIVVVDSVGGKTCVTKLLAEFDPLLKERLPETRGFYWERCPPVVISSADPDSTEGNGFDLITVDGQGQWRDAILQTEPKLLDKSALNRDSRIGQFDSLIYLKKSPVVGGIQLHSLQQRAGDIPLWRDQIPELSIKLNMDGIFRRFHLVSRDTTRVIPIRGISIPIPVDKDFTLPKGHTHYWFPLFQGENAEAIGFSARLDSPAFPLPKDVVCKLDLTFEFGADEPYKLIFTPRDKSFQRVRATWRRTEEGADALPPEYPAPMTLDDLHSFPDSKYGGTMNLIEKMSEASATFAKWTHRNQGDRIEKSIKGWCRFLVIQIWKDGRSTSDDLGLAKAAEEFKSSLSKVLASNQNATLAVRFLECCMHKDAPADCIQWITEQVNSGKIRERRAIGFALGSVSEQWQKELVSKLVTHQTNDVLRVFAYAIWREQHFVEKFSLAELRSILHALNIMLGSIKSCPPQKHKNDEWTYRNWVRATTEPLELLLGLLRTRSSSDPEIKMLLQPHQKISKELAKQIERVTDIVAQSDTTLFFSRVQISLKKPDGDRTPDLLYALRLYLTGEDGTNAIHITSISDSDSD